MCSLVDQYGCFGETWRPHLQCDRTYIQNALYHATRCYNTKKNLWSHKYISYKALYCFRFSGGKMVKFLVCGLELPANKTGSTINLKLNEKSSYGGPTVQFEYRWHLQNLSQDFIPWTANRTKRNNGVGSLIFYILKWKVEGGQITEEHVTNRIHPQLSAPVDCQTFKRLTL